MTTSWIRRAISGLALFATALSCQEIKPLFRNRAVVSADPAKAIPSPVAASHIDVAERVLMIRHLNVVNDPRFSAAPVLRAALKSGLVRAGQQDKTLATWLWKTLPYSSARFLREGWAQCNLKSVHCLDALPLRLSAVVFRPDLARFHCGDTAEGGDACGAEVRFDYSLIPPDGKPKLGLIVEFVLPTLTKGQFKALLADWYRLQLKSPGDLAGALFERIDADVFSATSTITARMRLNALTASEGAWRMYEFHFKGGDIREASLDGEIDFAGEEKGHVKWWKDRCEISPEAAAFVKSFSRDADVIELPEKLKPRHAQISLQPRSLELGQAVSGEVNRDKRFRLALNMCTGCHSNETAMGDPFTHVRYRAQDAVSQLSPFLTGADDFGDPTVSAFKVKREFPPPACLSECDTRAFNDLLRRHMFLYTVVNDLDPAQNNWTAKLTQYMTNLAH